MRTFVDGQRDLVRREAGDRHRDLETVLVEAFDVVWGIALFGGPLDLVENVEKAVEPDGRPPEGVQSYLISKSSLEQDGYDRLGHRPAPVSIAPEGCPGRRSGAAKKIWKTGKSFKGSARFFCKELGRLTLSFRAPPRRPSLARFAGRLPANGQHGAATNGGAYSQSLVLTVRPKDLNRGTLTRRAFFGSRLRDCAAELDLQPNPRQRFDERGISGLLGNTFVKFPISHSICFDVSTLQGGYAFNEYISTRDIAVAH